MRKRESRLDFSRPDLLLAALFQQIFTDWRVGLGVVGSFTVAVILIWLVASQEPSREGGGAARQRADASARQQQAAAQAGPGALGALGDMLKGIFTRGAPQGARKGIQNQPVSELSAPPTFSGGAAPIAGRSAGAPLTPFSQTNKGKANVGGSPAPGLAPISAAHQAAVSAGQTVGSQSGLLVVAPQGGATSSGAGQAAGASASAGGSGGGSDAAGGGGSAGGGGTSGSTGGTAGGMSASAQANIAAQSQQCMDATNYYGPRLQQAQAEIGSRAERVGQVCSSNVSCSFAESSVCMDDVWLYRSTCVCGRAKCDLKAKCEEINGLSCEQQRACPFTASQPCQPKDCGQ